MMKPKYLLFSAALLAMTQAVALTPVRKQAQMPAAKKQVNKTTLSVADKDAPAYTIVGKDSICQIFVYSPAPNQGLHLAYLTDDERWVDVGQLCASDFGPWGREKKMYRPFVLKANDGTWRALWSVNKTSPQFAVAYSEDLVTWRPQDYPIMKEKNISDVAAYQMEDGTFDLYLKTEKGKRYVHADKDFRTFQEDSLEASADEILWQRDTATINGKLVEGNDFEIPAIHLNYIRAWHKALAEEAKENSRKLPKNEADLKAYVADVEEKIKNDDKVKARQRFRICPTTMRMMACIMLCKVAESLIQKYGAEKAESQLKQNPLLWKEMIVKMQTPSMLSAFDVLADYQLENALDFFRSRIEAAFSSKDYCGQQAPPDRIRRGRNDTIFERLDVTFSFEQAQQQSVAIKGAGVTHESVRQMLKNWKRQGLINILPDARYQKVAATV